ncbi:MAG: class I SAM-dependent methyltransferase [Chloroflexota bacterium]|nr:class I SAM-dependent methyltransferase [Chloroflexota bacterium]
MSGISERYDSAASGYVQHWEPVLAAAARRLLDYCEPDIRRAIEAARSGPARHPARLLDIGTGAGSLALEALRRWPALEVIGADASAGMLEMARSRAASEFGIRSRRLTLIKGEAERLPLPDQWVDMCVSSFVFQLVRDRPTALREARRVLRPGARLAFVTWIWVEEDAFPPGEALDDVLDELGIQPPQDPDDAASGDYESAEAAAAQLRRAGFREVSAREEWLEYRWSSDSYLEYKLRYAERGVFSGHDEATEARARELARERLARLDPDAFVWRSPVVYAFGSRPR